MRNKWTKDLNRQFTKEDTQMNKSIYERGSIPLIIKKIQHKTTMRQLLEWQKIKKTDHTKCWRGHGQTGLLVEILNSTTTLEKQFSNSLKRKTYTYQLFYSYMNTEKNLHKVLAGSGKGTLLKYVRTFCSSYQGLPLGETSEPEPNQLEYYQNPTDLG